MHTSSPSTSAIVRLWNKLVEPPDHIPLSQRRPAQLLSAFLVAIIALGAVYELSYLWFGPTNGSFLIEAGISFGTLTILGVVYGLCRAGRVVLSAALTVAIMSLGVYAIVFIAIEDPNVVYMLNFLVIPLLVGNIFFGGKRILLTVAIYSIGIFTLPAFLPGARPSDLIVGPIPFLWITACIIVITNRHRDQVERDRQRDLVASERRFRALIEHIGDGIELIDARSRVSYISPSAQRILGYALADYEGDTAPELIHPDDLAAAAATMDLVLRSPGQPIHAAYRLRHKEGAWRWIEATLANFLDDPAVGSIVATFRDVTERKQRDRELETIATVSAALRTVPNRAGVLPVVLDQAMALLTARGAALVLRDPAHDHMGVELGRGVWAHTTGQRILAGEGIADQVMGTNQPFLSNDAWSDPSFGSAQAHGGLHIAVVPLAAQEYVIGALWMGLTNIVTENDMRLLTAIADIAASAIHRVTLFEQTEQRLHRLTALRAIDTAITASLDLRLALDILLEQVTTQLGIDAADVLLLDPHLKVLLFAAGRGFHGRAIERSHARLGEGYAGSAALERRTIAIPNLLEAAGFDRAPILEGEGFTTYFGVPLIAKGYVKGVLEVFHRTPVTPDADWQDFLDLLARQAAIAIDNAELFESLQRSNQELILAYDATIEGWSRALDLRDKETEGHTQRVTHMTERLARAVGIEPAEMVHIRRGALLHDIGKMGIPDNILLKPGKLTDEEWIIMRKHPSYADEMLSRIAFLRPALDIPYGHHEKWDGTGYPRGLKGEQIPLAARVFAVVDVWDALKSDRPYRPGWPAGKVLEHIRAGAGTHFDPQVVTAFLNMLDEERLNDVSGHITSGDGNDWG